MAIPKKTQKGKNKLLSKQMKLFRYNSYGSEAPKASNSMAMLDANKESARREDGLWGIRSTKCWPW